MTAQALTCGFASVGIPLPRLSTRSSDGCRVSTRPAAWVRTISLKRDKAGMVSARSMRLLHRCTAWTTAVISEHAYREQPTLRSHGVERGMVAE